MSRVDERFNSLRAKNEGALICFVTAGDPNIDVTIKLVLELWQGGADIIELGIPFSDPIADGPSIQASSQRALEHGMNIPKTLEIVRRVRAESDIPLILMSYYNPILRYGLSRFAYDIVAAGVDSTILTDLTPEESGEWCSVAERAGLNTIFLLAPTSTAARINLVAEIATGFIYCVSRTGVTGVRTEMAEGLRELVARIRDKTTKPIAVGFGISEPEHVREVCEYADGAVVGSRIVDLIASEPDEKTMLKKAHDLASALKAATKRNFSEA